MSVTEAPAPAAEAVERSLCGWGRAAHSRCAVVRALSAGEVADGLVGAARAGTGAIARGAGRSYGDAAQNGGGRVLDTTGMDGIVSIDRAGGLVRAQAGATVARLMAALAEHGLTLPVVPGTRHVTLAGAIASDIHGKNHHRDGAFVRHVVSLSLCTPDGEVREVSPEREGELFYATFGGMGLTGVILEATIAAEPLAVPGVAADTDRTDGLAQTLELMGAAETHRYSVAWLDLLARGPRMGRAVISRAEPLPAGTRMRAGGGLLGGSPRDPGRLLARPVVEVPQGFPAALLRPASIRTFNALRWQAAPRRERERPVPLAPFFFPLDGLGEWSRMYGPYGLLQYQFVIPAGREAELERSFELIAARRLPVYLAVFKRFGAGFGGPLSFPIEGWTLAIDMPAGAPGVHAALDELDELVAAAGGRVYLSKDLRMRPETVRSMYPQLERFLALRGEIDPAGVMRSDLGRRLELCA